MTEDHHPADPTTPLYKRTFRDRIVQLLFNPHPEVVKLAAWHQARLLSFLLLFLIVVATIGFAATLIVHGGFVYQNIYLVCMVVLLGVAYTLSRTKHFVIGIYLAIGIICMIAFAILFAQGDQADMSFLSLIIVAMILVGILLPSGSVITLLFATTILLLLSSLFIPGMNILRVSTVIGQILAIGVLFIVIDKYRENLERKRLDELSKANKRLQEFQKMLEIRVEERTTELEQKNRELEAFAYSISHDLKAPLRGIVGYSQLLISDYDDQLEEEGRLYLSSIRKAALQMGQLIDDLLDYSRMQWRELSQESVFLPDLVRKVLDERRDEVENSSTLLSVVVPEIDVFVEREGLEQALRNLLDNALKFTRGREQVRIEIDGYTTPNTCVIWVKDNGIGFDMQYHARIFEIFQRLNRPEEYEGTGIGLALVKMVAERVGGRTWAESVVDRGSTFYIELPIRSDNYIFE